MAAHVFIPNIIFLAISSFSVMVSISFVGLLVSEISNLHFTYKYAHTQPTFFIITEASDLHMDAGLTFLNTHTHTY